MSRYPFPDVSTATIEPLAEAELAERLAREGRPVRFAHGRHWRALRPGFYAPVHELAQLRLEEARRPGPCWGFVAPLHEADRAEANAAMPFHLLSDVAGYGIERLPRDTRRGLRRLDDRGVRFVAVTDAGIFHDQGYDLMMEWRRRKGWERRAPSRERFLAGMEALIVDPAALVIAAMDEDTMLGFVTVLAVEQAGYLEQQSVATAAARLQLLAGLIFHAVMAFQRCGRVRLVTPGPHEPEHASAAAYKSKEGFPVTLVPVRLGMPWPVRRYLRMRRPLASYRLTGDPPAPRLAAG